MTATAIAHRAHIVAQLSQGRLLRDIAADLGVNPGAISQYLAQDPEYQAARETGMEAQLDRWQAEIAAAPKVLNLARARESFRAVAWRAEREHPGRWGQRTQVVVEDRTQIDAQLIRDAAELVRRSRERVIAGDASVADAPLLAGPTDRAEDATRVESVITSNSPSESANQRSESVSRPGNTSAGSAEPERGRP